MPEKIIARLTEADCFKKAKACVQDHLEKALEIANELPASNFTDEIVAMFSSMSDRGN